MIAVDAADRQVPPVPPAFASSVTIYYHCNVQSHLMSPLLFLLCSFALSSPSQKKLYRTSLTFNPYKHAVFHIDL